MRIIKSYAIFFALIFFVNISLLKSQIILDKPLSKRIANYDIKANLDVDKKIIKGKLNLEWKNTSSDTLCEVRFHLYMNAFKNTASTFMQESGGQLRGTFMEISDENWGWIDIDSMRVKNGEILTDKISYIQPDDDNEHDQTVFSVLLYRRIAPGHKVNFEINFTTKLPKVFARTGFSNDYFFAGQWFPKVGVYENHKWNCHQFHANSEFFADFGVYNIDITVPENYIVGATGSLQKEVENSDKTKTFSYRAEDVIDFAWTCSPKFHKVETVWKAENKKDSVKVILLIQPEHIKLARRHNEAIYFALDYFNKKLGKYPYNIITVIDPPVSGGASGGMEYPTLITVGSIAGMPSGVKILESTAVHEFGHQYFMGMLASNEFEEAWLDEGMNTYFEAKIMDKNYGNHSSLFDFAGISVGNGESQRLFYVMNKNKDIEPVYQYSWEFSSSDNYALMSYDKSAIFLKTLENIIGSKTMDKIFKKYFEEFSFKHPKTKDFIKIVNELVKKEHGSKFGANMDWFFKQVLYGTQICDYELFSISNKQLIGYTGTFDDKGEKTYRKPNINSKKYRSKIIIRRNGNMIMPLEVAINFDDGEKIIKDWNGEELQKEFVFEGDKKIISAQLDPDNKILMDTNLNNNSKSTKSENTGIWKYILKFMFWLQNIMQSVAFFA